MESRQCFSLFLLNISIEVQKHIEFAKILSVDCELFS